MDVVGYSRLMERDEARTLMRLKRLRREVLDPAIATRSARMVKLMGDGALVEFASAVDAVTCAIDIQKSVHERSVGDLAARRTQLRIGINVGDIESRGHKTFKNIARAIEVFSVFSEDDDGLRIRQRPEARPGPPATDKPPIAVLAFNNMSTDTEQEDFSDGISEDMP